MIPPPDLETIPEGQVSLSDILKSVVNNYNTYNKVALDLRTLQDWVRLQSENNK